MMVTPRPCVICSNFPSIRAWCAQVTLTPEDSKTIVFSKGTWNGLNALIPAGGHKLPISAAGARLLWKNAQKKEAKNNTSDTIKSPIPHRSPSSTIDV